MPKGTNEKSNQGEESSLNSREGDSIPVNRGVELLLRNRRRKPYFTQDFPDKVWEHGVLHEEGDRFLTLTLPGH